MEGDKHIMSFTHRKSRWERRGHNKGKRRKSYRVHPQSPIRPTNRAEKFVCVEGSVIKETEDRIIVWVTLIEKVSPDSVSSIIQSRRLKSA